MKPGGTIAFSTWPPEFLTGRMFRLVAFVGRWSMLDVFVDAFVVALVQLPPVMSVRPGPGVPFFAATAVLTMLAAGAFDPRLVWDRALHP